VKAGVVVVERWETSRENSSGAAVLATKTRLGPIDSRRGKLLRRMVSWS
jgi:hypothetical protein